jgi:hypothetical protein
MLLKGLPVSRSESFNTAPTLVASNSCLHESSMPSAVVDSGSCESGDVLLLMSDAAASWYLHCLEHDDLVAEHLFFRNADDYLKEFFNYERTAGRIRNDDIAIIRIEIKQRSIG